MLPAQSEYARHVTAQSELPPVPPREQRIPSREEVGLSVVTLVVGFVVMASFVHQCIRDPLRLYAEIRSEKLAILELWRGRTTAAAFGSSHVDDGFDPRVFDREMATASHPVTSINLGVSGGSQTEQATMVDAYIQSLSPPQQHSPSRLALLEISASANFTEDHLFHPRAINIYDLATVKLALHFADRKRIGWRRAAGRAGFAVVAGILHYCNVGMLSSQIFSPPLNRDLFESQTSDDRRGLTPNPMAPRNSREWIADEALIRAPRAPRQAAGEIVEGHFVVLRRLAEQAQRQHVQFVYFVAPRLDNLESMPSYPASIAGPLGPILILNEGNPDLHPELYRAEMWHDPLHLTTAGAALFTKILADDLRSKLESTNGDVASGRDIALR